MNVIFLSKRKGSARQLNLAHPLTLSDRRLCLGRPGERVRAGTAAGRGSHAILRSASRPVSASSLPSRSSRSPTLKQQLQDRVDAMAMRLGQVNAHVIRLDALGKRLTEMANIDSREFNFDHDPPAGGPETEGEGVSAQIPDLSKMLMQLEQRVSLRESQLAGAGERHPGARADGGDPPGGPPGGRRLHLLVLRRAQGSVRWRRGLPQGCRLRR